MARLLAVTALALVVLVLPSLALAQGPADQAPDAAGDQGPPDHAAASEDQGPPDHAEASGDQAGTNGPASADANPPEASDQQDEAPEDEQENDQQASPDDTDEAPDDAAPSPSPSQEADAEDTSDTEDGSGDEAPADEPPASEPATEDAAPEADDGAEDADTSETSEATSAEVDSDETSTEDEDATDIEDEAAAEPVEDDATGDAVEDTDGTTDEATTTTLGTFRSTTESSLPEVEEDDPDEATTVESGSTSQTEAPEPDEAPPEDGTDAEAAAEAAEAVDLGSGTAGPGEASNPGTAPSVPWSGPQRSMAQSATPSWAATVPETSISWLLPSLAIGAVGAIALVRARSQTRSRRRRAPEPASEQPSEATQTPEEPDGSEPSTRELPEPGLEGVLRLGQQALDEGDLETAVGWFETAVAISPKAQAAHFCMGLCLDELDRLEEAADALENALELQPGDPLALFAQAGMRARMGRTGDALELAARLTREYPEFREAMAEDEAFDRLRDHPRFLALIGEL